MDVSRVSAGPEPLEMGVDVVAECPGDPWRRCDDAGRADERRRRGEDADDLVVGDAGRDGVRGRPVDRRRWSIKRDEDGEADQGGGARVEARHAGTGAFDPVQGVEATDVVDRQAPKLVFELAHAHPRSTAPERSSPRSSVAPIPAGQGPPGIIRRG